MNYRQEVRGIAGESWWTLGKVIGYVVLPLFALGAVLSALGVFSGVASAPARVVNRTLETDNIIYNYEWFKRQYQQIGAVTAQEADAQVAVEAFRKDAGPRKDWDFNTSAEYNRLNAVSMGLHNQRLNYVAEYNARARMANRSLFMGRDVPPEVQ